MSYNTQALLARDPDLIIRAAACAATQNVPDPETWAWRRQWQFSSQPGWDEAYAYAIASGSELPGKQESVITDNMILSAVQSIIAAESS